MFWYSALSWFVAGYHSGKDCAAAQHEEARPVIFDQDDVAEKTAEKTRVKPKFRKFCLYDAIFIKTLENTLKVHNERVSK